MKRLSILLAAATLLAAIAGCQKEPAGNENASDTDVYVQFTINFADGAATKADYNSPDVAVGTDDEHAVKYAYLYFFDDTAEKKYVKTVKIASGDITSSTVMTNIVKKTTVPTRLAPGTYNVYATINHEVTGLVANTTTAAAFEQMQYTHPYASYDIANNGIPMSSRESDGTMSQEDVTITSYNTIDNPVQIELYMERMLAKVTVKETGSGDYEVTEERNQTGPTIATVDLTSYKYVNLPTLAYLFRHVGTEGAPATFGELTSAGTPPAPNNYVVEPETSLKNNGLITGLHFYQQVNAAGIGYTALPTVGNSTAAMYCTENTMYKDAQYKTYASAIAFAGLIKPAAGRYYAAGSVEGATPGDYTSGDLWYFDGFFYADLTALNNVKGLSLSENPSASNYYGKFGVKKYVDAVCYYTYYIRHYDNYDPQEMGVMEFAMVRNNDYQVTIQKIVSLGQDTPNVPVEEIEATESYFQATLLVRPWVVRAQQAVLG